MAVLKSKVGSVVKERGPRTLGRRALPASRIWALGRRDPDTGCLLWTRSRGRDGYGQVRVKGRMRRVHRVAWELANHRRIPDGAHVRHRCDVRRCFEPTHLRAGSPRQNVADARTRGRLCVGERHPRAKLTTGVVLGVRQLAQAGVPMRRLALALEVAPSTIGKIVSGRAWAHVQ